MAVLTICYVRESLIDGPAFAIRADNDEEVFISRATAERLNLEPMDTVKCLLVENTVRPDKTPWFAPFVRLVPEGFKP